MAYPIVFALEAVDKFCYQLNQIAPNETLAISTRDMDARNDSIPYEDNKRFRTYCWNITFPQHVEIHLTLDIGPDPHDRVSVHLSTDDLLSTTTLGYNTDMIASTESPTIVLISIHDNTSFASFQIEQTPDNSGKDMA